MTFANDPDDMSTPAEVEAQLDPQVRVRSSARGWSGIQLALMGFIGLCGVLQTPGGPYAVQFVGGLLALAALVLAVAGAVIVALVAWPLSDTGPARGQALLRAGVAFTLVSGALIGLAGLSGWWPERAAGTGPALVEIGDAAGRTACGALADSGSGSLALLIDDRRVTIPLRSLSTVRPVDRCR